MRRDMNYDKADERKKDEAFLQKIEGELLAIERQLPEARTAYESSVNSEHPLRWNRMAYVKRRLALLERRAETIRGIIKKRKEL
jgi:hypothetical protein